MSWNDTTLITLEKSDYTGLSVFSVMMVVMGVQAVVRIRGTLKKPTTINIGFAFILVMLELCMVLQLFSLFVSKSVALWTLWTCGENFLSLVYLMIQIELARRFGVTLGYKDWMFKALMIVSILVHFVFNSPFYLIHAAPFTLWDTLAPYSKYFIVWYLWAVVLDLGISITLIRNILGNMAAISETGNQFYIKFELIGGCVIVALGYLFTIASGALHIDPYNTFSSAVYALHYTVGTRYLAVIARYSKQQSKSSHVTIGSKSQGSAHLNSSKTAQGSTPEV